MIDLIAVGRILKPTGIHGDLKILPFAENFERFASLKTAWIGVDEKSAVLLVIDDVRIESKFVVINLENINTLNEADKFRNQFVFIPREEIKLRNGSFLIDDVIGCEVQTVEMLKVGIVEDVLRLPANDLWVIKDGKKEIMIPAVKEFISKVDIKAKCITIKTIEGLL